MGTPSAADLPCIGDDTDLLSGYINTEGDEEFKKSSTEDIKSSIDLGLLAALRRRRQQRTEEVIQCNDESNEVVVHDGDENISNDKSSQEYVDTTVPVVRKKNDIKFKDATSAAAAAAASDEIANSNDNDNEDVTNDDEENSTLKANFIESVQRVNNSEDIRPAIVISGTSMYIRLEKRDFLKVRSASPFFWTGTETVTPTADTEAEPFYRIKAVKEQGTVGFDTRNPSKIWIPIPLCLQGGRILIGRLTPFVFLASKSTACKVVLTESRCYPTLGAVKFEVENFGPAERFLGTVIEDCQESAPTKSPSITVPPSFFAVAMQTILHNPNNRMNQIGGGIVLLQVPSNTLRLRLDCEDSLNVNGVEIIAWTQGVRFTFSKTWFFARKLIAIKGPGTVWISADMSVTNVQNPTKIAYTMTQ